MDRKEYMEKIKSMLDASTNMYLYQAEEGSNDSVCSSQDELGFRKNVQYTQKRHLYVVYGLILGVCGLLNTLWSKQCPTTTVESKMNPSTEEMRKGRVYQQQQPTPPPTPVLPIIWTPKNP